MLALDVVLIMFLSLWQNYRVFTEVEGEMGRLQGSREGAFAEDLEVDTQCLFFFHILSIFFISPFFFPFYFDE